MNWSSAALRSRRRERRGVLLLIVLVLLVLFLMLGVAFVLTAQQFRGGTRSAAKAKEYKDETPRIARNVMLDIIRGPVSQVSSLKRQSLLEDMYGNDGFRGTAGAITPAAGGQVHQFSVTRKDADSLSQVQDYYAGCVLTILDGPMAGQSRRIVSTSGATFYVDAFNPGVDNTYTGLAGATVLINGRPFNGTGNGYNPTSGKNDAVNADGVPYALLPHLRRFVPSGSYTMPLTAGGLDEDYDAPDFNNAFLAYVPAIPDLSIASGGIKPSFHDPALFSYLAPTDPNVSRQILFRPLVADNPNFTGSNPLFNPVNGPWDVDNDGDLINDSIWIDFGSPVMKARDGRLFKYLVSPMILDLDGRVNLNSAGMLDHTLDTFYDTYPGSFHRGSAPIDASAVAIPRGSGYGAAEINPKFILSGGQAELLSLLVGDANLNGRYGNDGQTTAANRRPGRVAFDDLQSQLLQYHLFGHHGANDSLINPNNNTAHDFRGNGLIGLDAAGNPFFNEWGASSDFIDDPYEVDLLGTAGTAAYDELYTPGELEAILRYRDADAGALPNRLRLLAPSALAHDRGVTTMSFDLPSPSMVGPLELRVNGPKFMHIADILAERMRDAGITDEALIATQVSGMLPPDVLGGLRFDVNRPFGNGRDDNSNGIIDEPLELANEIVYWKGSETAPTSPSGILDARFKGISSNLGPARQLFAKQLYVLAMTLQNVANTEPTMRAENPAAAARAELTAQRLAQWAVNVVDFRDPDSIMTAFEYDANPFNGWQVDDDPATDDGTTDRRLVFGVEAPALMLTEASAWHDRRVHDSDTDGDGNDKIVIDPPDPMAVPDTDMDQWGMPRGSVFFELYCPLNPNENKLFSQDIQDVNGNVKVGAVTGNGEPVWRLVVSKPASDYDLADKITNTPDTEMFQPDAADIDRTIWLGGTPADVDTYRPTTNVTLGRGQYLVVGPRATTEIGHGVNAIFQTITLNPGGGSKEVDVTSPDGTTTPDADIKDMKAMICEAPAPALWTTGPATIGMSISEPKPSAYYAEPQVDATGTGSWVYDATVVTDVPWDDDPNRPLAEMNINGHGTHAAVKAVFLQRLADPTRDFNANSNPYITVDWMPIDLTVFNAKEEVADDPWEMNKVAYTFETRERGDNGGANLMWAGVSEKPANSATDAAINTSFKHKLGNTLGYLNSTYHPYYTTAQSATYAGEPQSLLKPWLTWVDRPYVSGWEVMNVPSSAPGRLFWEYHKTLPGDHGSQTDPYNNLYAPYPHLLNFFHSSATVGSGAEYVRLLEYLHVPSKFVGTSKVIDPAGAATTSRFTPPYNLISAYRDPGRINLNTIADPAVYYSLMNGVPSVDSSAFSGPSWTMFNQSRGGNQTVALVGNPFRSAASAGLDTFDTALASPAQPERSGAEVSIFRPHPSVTGISLFAGTESTAYRNAGTNPYFRYQNFTRLGNKVTTRSHCFAIWITIGMFEVEPVASSTIHPDGYRLGREYGSDTGEIQRTRAFGIVDRSIPVGFESGQDNNVEDAILLWRVIE